MPVRSLFLLALLAACVPDNPRRASTVRTREPQRPADAGLGVDDAGGADAGEPHSDATTPVDLGFGGDAGFVLDAQTTPPRDAGAMGSPDAAFVEPRYDQCTSFAQSLEVEIRVDDSGNTVTRDPPLTGLMLPFAQSTNLRSLNALIVVDGNGARLPAQFETLSRWNARFDDCNAPIRHAYAFVRAVPPPGGTATWRVRLDTGAVGETTSLSIAEQSDRWVIDTGRARFTVRRDRFEGISKVEINGATVSEIGGAAGSAGFVVDQGGAKSTAHNRPWKLELERSGPQMVTVAARGFYGARAGDRGLGYTVRMHFVAGSAVAKVDHTYYHGAVADWSASGATNRTRITRAYWRVPVPGAAQILARADRTVHPLAASGAVQLEQVKRTPSARAVAFRLTAGGNAVENGNRARNPFLAVVGSGGVVVATIARIHEREPQGLRWNPAAGAIEVDFTSTEMMVGGARGIYGTAAIDFAAAGDPATRATQLQLHNERPLVAVTALAHLNATNTIGPYASSTSRNAALFTALASLHTRTKQYLEQQNITGIQAWPDMPRESCTVGGGCGFFYSGGDNNYWNWSKPSIDEFFRTGKNEMLYDFSLGEAATFAETIAFRTDHDRNEDSSTGGLAPCYGDAYGWGSDYQEGNQYRRDRCVGDYTYNKTLKLAYLATADRRFVDFFEEAGDNAVSRFGTPPADRTEEWLELTFSRLSWQRLENVANGAEFSRDPASADRIRGALRSYVDFMLARTLIAGHACNTSGTGSNNALADGRCDATDAWMMPSPLEFARRTGSFLDHAGLKTWVRQHAEVSARNHTVLGGNGLPDYSRRDTGGAWRSFYTCRASLAGVDQASCQKVTNIENNGLFYLNGMVSYLNVYGLVLGADRTDPNRICQWLPQAYASAVTELLGSNQLTNDLIWGKASGQAFFMSPEAAGAIAAFCP